jgi:hypothetical protein
MIAPSTKVSDTRKIATTRHIIPETPGIEKPGIAISIPIRIKPATKSIIAMINVGPISPNI